MNAAERGALGRLVSVTRDLMERVECAFPDGHPDVDAAEVAVKGCLALAEEPEPLEDPAYFLRLALDTACDNAHDMGLKDDQQEDHAISAVCYDLLTGDPNEPSDGGYFDLRTDADEEVRHTRGALLKVLPIVLAQFVADQHQANPAGRPARHN